MFLRIAILAIGIMIIIISFSQSLATALTMEDISHDARPFEEKELVEE